jgi:hypothetical protein
MSAVLPSRCQPVELFVEVADVDRLGAESLSQKLADRGEGVVGHCQRSACVPVTNVRPKCFTQTAYADQLMADLLPRSQTHG